METLANPTSAADNSRMNWDYIRGTLKRLKAAKNDISDNELERLSGVPQPTISRFLKADTEYMSLDNLAAIAQALDATVSEVIGERPLEFDDKARRVLKAMQDMPEYKKDAVLSTAEALAKDEKKAANGE